MKYKVLIERGEDNTFDACLDFYDNIDFGLIGSGKTSNEAIEDFYKSMNDMKSLYKEKGKAFPEMEFEFIYDIPSFLSYYSNVLSLSGLEKITGINQRQLSHYLTGYRNPSKKTAAKIEKALHNFSEELSQVQFI